MRNFLKGEGEMHLIKSLFSELSIEYYSVLDYKDVRQTGEHIMRRAGFEPRSVIVYLIPYYGGECKNISRYAASLDYHIAARELGTKIIDGLKREFPKMQGAAFGDHSPIDERHAALISGLGIIGDNGLIITEKYGSYVFIGDVVTDIPPEALCAVFPKEIKRCESCGKCKSACPTGILRSEGEDCLSAITQRKGELSKSEAELMRKYNTAWGCDICQQVCPHNREPEITPIEFFLKDRITELSAESLSSLTDDALKKRAFGWRGRAVLERNVEILKDKK